MSRQLVSRATEWFLGAVTYALAEAGKPGAQVELALNFKDYGVISTADADGVCASQSVTGAALALINGALAAAGVATFATPRNVVAAWTNTAILTITGTDEYGAPLVELTASGTSHTGKKAFKTITSVVPNANITGATVGEGVVIGLPHRVDENGLIRANLDGAFDAATFVEADTTTATGTTGDIRGTVSFSAAPDGTRKFAVFYKIAGVSTKALAYGVSQFTA